MSTLEFNRLFAGYDLVPTAVMRRLKGEVHTSIARSLKSVNEMRHAIVGINFDERHKLDKITTGLARLDVLATAGVPQAVRDTASQMCESAADALRAYHEVSQSSKKRGAQREHFKTLKAAYVKVLDELIAWLRSIKPDVD